MWSEDIKVCWREGERKRVRVRENERGMRRGERKRGRVREKERGVRTGEMRRGRV